MIRRPAVAGLFYSADPSELTDSVDALLDAASPEPNPGLLGVVAPHAGYVYSGPIAASAFALLPRVQRVALLGPSHFVPLDGLAVSGAEAWATPLGDVALSDELRDAALGAVAVVDDEPHAREHALEVELPFLQRTCGDALEIVPVAVGRSSPAAVALLMEALDAFLVVSTDLSHYLDDKTAKRVDAGTARAVVERRPQEIGEQAACGVFALRGLVEHARRSRLQLELLDLRTSADTAGEPSRVVGYGAFALRGVA